ncbi:MAG TPA: DUF4129 domain-containing protein [Chloroflexota bacterium]|nr:DUF4129 domain-containing protein [Chloroflexota bacterium]
MAKAVSVFGVVLCISAIEGVWVWLLAAAISEVAGQRYPSLIGVVLILALAWLTVRILVISDIALERRRLLLIAGGLALALGIGTVHAGVAVPPQLLIGTYEPDLRGAGIALVILIAYLWGRGLALAAGLTRERVIGHIAVSTSALCAVLVFLPLTGAVQRLGFGAVVTTFALAIAALLLIQAMGVEARELTPSRWGMVAGGFTILLMVGAAGLTGILSSGFLLGSARTVGALGRQARPLTDALLLALGHVAEAIAMALRWLAETIGADPSAIVQNMRGAEESRPKIEDQAPQGPPEVLTVLVAATLTLLFCVIVIAVFHRLVGHASASRRDEIEEVRQRLPRGRAALLGWFGRKSADGDDLVGQGVRVEIRRAYRAFQSAMARAGVPRAPGETPREYGRLLASILPAGAADLAQIARAYSVARYSDESTPVPSAEEVRQAVRRLRAVLRDAPPDVEAALHR